MSPPPAHPHPSSETVVAANGHPTPKPASEKLSSLPVKEGKDGAFAVDGTRTAPAKPQSSDWTGPLPGSVYGGIAVVRGDAGNLAITLAIRDSTYFLDFEKVEVHGFAVPEHADQTTTPSATTNGDSASQNPPHPLSAVTTDFILTQLTAYAHKHNQKFLGLALPSALAAHCPTLCSRVWQELDAVPLVFAKGIHDSRTESVKPDQLADSMARECIMFFGPNGGPMIQANCTGEVEVDAGSCAHIASLADYEKATGSATWRAIQRLAAAIRNESVQGADDSIANRTGHPIKIAFFSATPQGGGVALMRHALVRFLRLLGVDIAWYVPSPDAAVFRITKTNHNILQGVAAPDERLSAAGAAQMQDWIQLNAARHWFGDGRPLAPADKGGADFIVIDDPQMPGLIPMIKHHTPEKPIVYRSHIQVRSDLVAIKGSPQDETWGRLWDTIRLADVFISQPVKAFVPHTVPADMVGYMPATTDWLDGLNKPLTAADSGYYGRLFNSLCRHSMMNIINYPDDQYIIQVARFDPSKGIPDVINSYARFHARLRAERPDMKPPKLLLCGHASVDDPDGAIIYDQTLDQLAKEHPHLQGSVCVMRLPPSDQLLDVLMRNSTIALQLSTREGFEVKVVESLYHGKPVITTRAGGIPLQVRDRRNGFLVNISDSNAVADHLFDLWTDPDLYARFSAAAAEDAAATNELNTVGNAVSWLYLALRLTGQPSWKPDGAWISDLARPAAGEPFGPDELRLNRDITLGEVRFD